MQTAAGRVLGDEWVEFPLGFYERSWWVDGVEVLLFTHEVAGLPPGVEPSRSDLLGIVDRLYGTLWQGEHVQEPEERPVGALRGVLAGWRSSGEPSPIEEGVMLFEAQYVFLAADDTWLYAVPISANHDFGLADDWDAFQADVAALAERVAQLPISITDPVPRYPLAADDWALESGDILVAAEDGLHVLRHTGDGWVPAQRVITEPMHRASSDGGTGLVYQLSARYRMSEPIWWLPGPAAEPVMVADIEPTTYPYLAPYHPLELIDVATIDEERRVLYERFNAGLYSYSLDTGVTTKVAGIDGIDCVAWTGDRYVITTRPEGYPFINEFADGDWHPSGIDLEAGSACVASDGQDTVLVAYYTIGELPEQTCADLAEQVIARADLDSWALLDPVHDLGAPIELCLIETLDSNGEEALVYTRGWDSRFETGSTRLIDLETGKATELPIPGAATFVP